MFSLEEMIDAFAARIPEGAWYCDMGKVHYARSEKGDGVCPLCKMQLTEKGPAPAE